MKIFSIRVSSGARLLSACIALIPRPGAPSSGHGPGSRKEKHGQRPDSNEDGDDLLLHFCALM